MEQTHENDVIAKEGGQGVEEIDGKRRGRDFCVGGGRAERLNKHAAQSFPHCFFVPHSELALSFPSSDVPRSPMALALTDAAELARASCAPMLEKDRPPVEGEALDVVPDALAAAGGARVWDEAAAVAAAAVEEDEVSEP